MQAQTDQAHVAVHNIAFLNHHAAHPRIRAAFALEVHIRRKPEWQAQIIDPLHDPPLHIRGGGHAGMNEASAEHIIHNIHHHAVDLGIDFQFPPGPRLNPADDDLLRADQRHASVQRHLQVIIQILAQAVGHGALIGNIHMHSGRLFPRNQMIQRLKDIIPAVHGLGIEPVKARIGPGNIKCLIVALPVQAEDQTGGAACVLYQGRHQRRKHGILIIFPGNHHPHFDTAFLHQLRHQAVDAFFQNLIVQGILFFHSPHRHGFLSCAFIHIGAFIIL